MTKWTILSLLSSTMLVAPLCQADTFSIEAPIKKVTVYKGGGAFVTRMGTARIPSGNHTIMLQNLHEDLQDADIPPQVTVNSGNAKILDMKLQSQPSGDFASEQQQMLTNQIHTLEQQITSIKNQVAANDMRLSFIENIGRSQTSQSSVANISTLKEALDFVGTNTANILTSNQALKTQINDLRREQNALKRELARTGEPRDDYQQAKLSVDSQSAQDVTVSFSYFVADASWDMDVNAALLTDDKSLDISLAAAVRQQTGENWNNIALSLSNTRPASYVGNINVPSQFIEFATNIQKLQRMERGAAYAPQAEFQEIVVADAQVTATSSRFDRKYEVSGLTDILSTGETERVTILQAQTDVDIVSRAAPFLNTTAYVYADTTLTDFMSVRNIDVTLSRDGHFAGTGRWPNLESDTPLELPYGADNTLGITYLEQAPEDGDTGFLSKKNVEEKRFLISVTNNGSTAAPVEIFDRYPVSTHEDIKVEPLKTATKPIELDLQNKPGVIKWQKTLMPGETWHIRHEYKVTYPSDKNIRRSHR